ncbi:MAG TPA: di-heme oxidoredictase family protein [Edaphobacter sp.]|nr:di-heme oxidoredictase family protein [Edaphobacter sp.]
MSLRTAALLSGFVLTGVVRLAIGPAEINQQSAREAPAGFNTPSFNGGQSVSNGIVEPPGDSFALDQQVYELNHSVQTGLGPVYNATACVSCHENPNSGGASQITELRVGHNDSNGNFVNPTISINDGMNTITGRSIVNDRAICPQAQEHIPATENIRALRAVLNTLGDGFVEAIDDNTLVSIAAHQPEESDGMIHGEVVEAPIFEAPGQTRVGRFGWKDQHSSLLSFIADAYVNEMGVTNRLRKVDVTNVCKTTTDPEDQPDDLGLADIDHFAQFIRGTMVPPRNEALAATAAARQGHELFKRVGCAACHVPSITTAPAGTVIGGGMFTVPEALGNKVIHPFSDFLLHDIGTGDGIVQVGPQDTANKLRTAPLWGLRTKARFMHDLQSLSLENAIERHRGEARDIERRFNELTPRDRGALLTFLNSL